MTLVAVFVLFFLALGSALAALTLLVVPVVEFARGKRDFIYCLVMLGASCGFISAAGSTTQTAMKLVRFRERLPVAVEGLKEPETRQAAYPPESPILGAYKSGAKCGGTEMRLCCEMNGDNTATCATDAY